MAGMIEDLIFVMKREEEIYRELVPVAEEKTRVIIKNDLTALQEITDREQLIVEKVNSLERRREEVIINIGTVLGRKPETITVKVLLEILKDQPEDRQKLAKVHDDLLSVVKHLVMINDRNGALIKQSLEMIEFNMNLIQGTRMSPNVNNYTRGAYEENISLEGTRTFDHKQ